MHVASYWAATAQQQPQRPILEDVVQVDVAVLGGGFTGLSTAYHLQKMGYKTAIVEEHCIGWGASGRNGSLMLVGFKHNLYTLTKKYGVETTKQMLQMSLDGIKLVKEISDEHQIDCEFINNGSLLAAYKPSHLEKLKLEQEFLEKQLNYENSIVEKKDLKDEIDSPLYHGGLVDPNSCYLHPLKYAIGLADTVESLGAKIYEKSRVSRIEQEKSKIILRTSQGQITANHLVVATNGYTTGITKKLARSIVPVGSYILTTEPMDEDTVKRLISQNRGVFDTKKFLYYFRFTKDHRLLFGGRVDFRAEENQMLYHALRENMVEVFPQLSNVGIDYTWGGKVALTFDLLPHLGQINERTFFALGYSGHGVSLSTLMGKLLAYKVDKNEKGNSILERFPLKQIPFHEHRALVLNVVGSYYRFLDWVS